MDEMVQCCRCQKHWPADCEQAVSIELFGECAACWFVSKQSTQEDYLRWIEEINRRNNDNDQEKQETTMFEINIGCMTIKHYGGLWWLSGAEGDDTQVGLLELETVLRDLHARKYGGD